MSFSLYSHPVAIDSFRVCLRLFWELQGFSERSSPKGRRSMELESAGPLCLGAAHTHPSGVSAELTALSSVWGALCVSLYCLLASWIGPLLQWASVCEHFTKKTRRRADKEERLYYKEEEEEEEKKGGANIRAAARWCIYKCISVLQLVLANHVVKNRHNDVICKKFPSTSSVRNLAHYL